MIRAESLQCPRCGGTLSWEPGRRVIFCDYCNGPNVVVSDDEDVSRYFFREKTTPEDAQRRARRLIGKVRGIPAGLRQVKFEKPVLYYIPFYNIRGIRASSIVVDTGGGAAGSKRFIIPNIGASGYMSAVVRERKSRSRKLRSGERGGKYDDTRIIMSDVDINNPAVNLPDWGIESIRIKRSLKKDADSAPEPFDIRSMQKRGSVLSPTVSVQKNLENSFKTLTRYDAAENRILDQDVNLIYYPVWRITYRYHGIPYHIVLDGMTGERLYARFPHSETQRILTFLSTVGFIGIMAGFLVYTIISAGNPDKEFVRVGFFTVWSMGIGSGSFLLWWIAFAWVRLRFPMEIVFNGDFASVVYVGKKGLTWPERFYKKLKKLARQRRAMRKQGWFD